MNQCIYEVWTICCISDPRRLASQPAQSRNATKPSPVGLTLPTSLLMPLLPGEPAQPEDSRAYAGMAWHSQDKARPLHLTRPFQPLQPFTTPSRLICTKACGKGRVHYTDGETEAGDTTSSLSHCLAPSTVALQAGVSLLALNKTLWDPSWHGCRKETGEEKSSAASCPLRRTVTMEVQVTQHCD